ncbi:uncharacterized protein BO72DRAFT_180922 [Aspergillus fijiensis CBS 313.89]|uniref:Transmembrane protein n=1 Tax=Aspergillus fijiensis CBS 313.89 TaxID=1448319 RepID=A0A8G1S1Y9_9EURO|nr:uncharacterized protein BO72DRAFT_180922 [Aspergillus fijiensis CBS 313.89]RAK81910.1 hypothetical protein BO72DRAFT_180922 [Aspergillus fijiensis CBS 313.89]
MQPPLHRRVHTLPSPPRRRSEGENRFIPEDPYSVRFCRLIKTDATVSCCLRAAKDLFFFVFFFLFLLFSFLSFFLLSSFPRQRPHYKSSTMRIRSSFD